MRDRVVFAQIVGPISTGPSNGEKSKAKVVAEGRAQGRQAGWVKAESYPYHAFERSQLIAQAKEFEHEEMFASMRFVEEVLTGRWTKDWGKDFNETPDQLFKQLQQWIDLESEKNEIGRENPYIDGLKWSNKVSGGWIEE